jgi:hypothetical protein
VGKPYNLVEEFKEQYLPPANRFTVVDVGPAWYLMVDGGGDPNGVEFMSAVQALYSTAYTLKFGRKKAGRGPDFKVAPLEGLWWAETHDSFLEARRNQWRWTALIRLPDFITAEEVEKARDEVRVKKPEVPVDEVRRELFHEGQAVQILYRGPYADEGPTIAGMHAFIAEQGYRPRGKHHEIYLGDPRRCAPERLRTVLRHQVEKR